MKKSPSQPLGRSLWSGVSLYIGLLILVFIGSSMNGPIEMSFASLIDSLWFHLQGSEAGADQSGNAHLLGQWWQYRAIPMLFAGAIGALLSLAGVLFQAVLRNPLAEPYVLGVSGGASLGVISLQLFGPLFFIGQTASSDSGQHQAATQFGSGQFLMLGASLGAGVAILSLIALSQWAKLRDSASLILCGTVLNSIFGALILICYSLAEQQEMASSMMWLMGNLGSEVTLVYPFALPIALLVLLAGLLCSSYYSRPLDLLSLSDEEASDLGIEVKRLRMGILLLASMLTAAAVACAGPIGFVGLIVPHLLRFIHGPNHKALIIYSALVGASLLMLAQLCSKWIFAPTVIPVGAVTALLGGPFFLFLLGIRRRQESTAL